MVDVFGSTSETGSRSERAVSSSVAWYCLRTQRKKEGIAVASIEKETGLAAFSPRISFYKMTRTGRKRFIEAVFPGYLFVHCSIEQHLRHLMSVRGVSGVVRYGNRIPTLPGQAIAELQARFPSSLDAVPVEQDEFSRGETVQVVEGAFKGLNALFNGYLPSAQRIQILIEMLGRQLPVAVSCSAVVRAEPASPRVNWRNG